MKAGAWSITAIGILGLWLCFSSSSARADLIEPSRDLGGTANATGNVWVFSEPPGLKVQIDGKEVGQTPVINHELEFGSHVVQVLDKKTEIDVLPGKSTRLSFFKGQMFVLPETEVTSAELSERREIQAPLPLQKNTRVTNTQNQESPFYWPLNPRGPIN